MVAAEATGKEKWPARLLVAPIPRSRASARPTHIGCFAVSRPEEKNMGKVVRLLWGFPRSDTLAQREPPNAGCTAKESEETPEERPIEEGSEGNP